MASKEYDAKKAAIKAQLDQKIAELEQKVYALNPGLHEDHPADVNMFDDTQRAQSSFGDPAGIAELVTKNGFKNVKYNANGDLVAQGKDGKWYKDAANFFSNPDIQGANQLGDIHSFSDATDYAVNKAKGAIPSHPINWAEAHMGHALPDIGMIGGDIAGTALAPALGPLAPAGPVIGGGVGAGFGEGLRAGAGKYFGTYKGGAGDIAADVGKEALKGAGGVALAKGLGALPLVGVATKELGPGADWIDKIKNLKTAQLERIGTLDEASKTAIQNLLSKLQRGAAFTSSVMTGGSKDAFDTLYRRPKDVFDAYSEGKAYRAANAGAEEFQDRAASENARIEKARQAADEKNADTQIGTGDLIDMAGGFVNKYQPKTTLGGPVSNVKLGRMAKIADSATTKMVEDQPNPMAVGSREIPGDVHEVYTPIEPTIEYGKPQEQTLPHGSSFMYGEAPTAQVSEMRRGWKASDPVTMQDPSTFENAYAYKTFPELKQMADTLNERIRKASEVSGYGASAAPNGKKERYIQALKQAVKIIKEKLHAADPEYGAADSRFTDFSSAANLVKPIEKEATAEKFVQTMVGPNNTARRNAAKALMPDTYQQYLEPMLASDELDHAGLLNVGLNPNTMLRAGLGTALGTGGGAVFHASGLPSAAAIAAGVGTMLSPQVHKVMGGKTFQHLINPALTGLANNSEDAAALAIKNYWENNPWSLYKAKENK